MLFHLAAHRVREIRCVLNSAALSLHPWKAEEAARWRKRPRHLASLRRSVTVSTAASLHRAKAANAVRLRSARANLSHRAKEVLHRRSSTTNAFQSKKALARVLPSMRFNTLATRTLISLSSRTASAQRKNARYLTLE